MRLPAGQSPSHHRSREAPAWRQVLGIDSANGRCGLTRAQYIDRRPCTQHTRQYTLYLVLCTQCSQPWPGRTINPIQVRVYENTVHNVSTLASDLCTVRARYV